MQVLPTIEEFSTVNEYIQALIDFYVEVKKDLYTFSQREKEIIDLMNKMIQDNSTKGRFVLEGTRDKVRIERRQNISYVKERKQEHPLKILLNRFEDILESKVRIEYKESGNKIQDLVDKIKSGDPHTEDERLLVEKLEEVRVLKPGKPIIEITPLKNES